MKRVFLALGSNLGKREANLRQAVRHLEEDCVQKARLSPIYETEPVGYADQGLFLNAVLDAATDLSPHDLLVRVKHIESLMKRRKTFRNGPRLIDIDILFYESEIVQTPELEIPHPRFRERRFVLAPMADLAPDWRDPVTHHTMAELLAKL